MILRTLRRPSPDKRCDVRLFYPGEKDGPGTIAIHEFRCLLRRGHPGPHQVEELRETCLA